MPEDAFTVSAQVGNRKTGQTETVDALVGSGNALAIMPSSLLHRLGDEPEGTMHFRSEYGGRVEFPVGHVHFSVQGAEGTALVVFGPEGRCELGSNTLSALLLEPDLEAHLMVPAIALLPTVIPVEEDVPGD
jgi:hypothetical protein